jgi:hypothetical protein
MSLSEAAAFHTAASRRSRAQRRAAANTRGESIVTVNKLALLAGAALALAVNGAAVAQTMQGTLGAGADQTGGNFRRDRTVSVLQRPHPDYQAIGIHTGGFLLYPKLTASGEYDSNIFATKAAAVSDGVFRISPELDLNTTWSRHSLQAYARGVFNQYAQNSNQNTTDYAFGALGQLDVLRSAQLNGGFDISRYTEPRTSAGSEGQRFPVQYLLDSAYFSGAKEFNRLRLSGRFDWRKFNYENREGNAPQDDRDRTILLGTARADYALSPDTALFVEVAANNRDYRLSSSPIVDGVPEFPGFVDKNSHGYQVLAGANFELTNLVRGEVGLGYLQQNYKSSAFDDVSGLGARGQLEWFPSQLATVTLTGSRTVEDAEIVGASSYISTNFGAQLDYELRRNLILSATGAYGHDDYKGLDRTDKRYSAGLSATYYFRRGVGFTLAYNHTKQDSSGLDSSVLISNFDIDRVGLTVTLLY